MGILGFLFYVTFFIGIFFDFEFPFYCVIGALAILEVVAIIRSIIYSKKECVYNEFSF